MRPASRTRLFAASLAPVATLALVACGDDDDDDTSATTETVDPTETTEGKEATESTGTTDTTDTADTTETSVGDTTASSAGGEVGSREDYVEAATAGFPVEDEDLAACIAEALITTAAGLTVAIPALLGYKFLRGRVDSLVVQMEKESIKLVQAMEERRDV